MNETSSFCLPLNARKILRLNWLLRSKLKKPKIQLKKILAFARTLPVLFGLHKALLAQGFWRAARRVQWLATVCSQPVMNASASLAV